MKPVVFLGPSLSHTEARRILDAEYRPPIRRGDLLNLPPEVDIVGIVDGVFMSEILSLLETGTKVVGGGSMGALRAAELGGFGMKGVGEVFEMYARGEIDGDDEVALIFNPETLDPLSEPLVNIRCNLASAAKAGVLSDLQAHVLLRTLKETYFPNRTFSLLFEIARRELGDTVAGRVREHVETSGRNVKKSDALMVIATIKNLIQNSE